MPSRFLLFVLRMIAAQTPSAFVAMENRCTLCANAAFGSGSCAR
jgi:hypothetical protein